MQLKEDIKEYWNLRSAGFSGAIMQEKKDRGEDLYNIITEALNIKTGSKVLDLGCGPGLFSMLLGSHGMDVVGIDYSEDMVSRAWENAASEGLDIEFMKMDAHSLDFEDGVFDAVVSRDVLWGLVDPEKAYREMLRVLRPGGKAYVQDGNMYLYLFDERYRTERNKPRSEEHKYDYHSKFNTDGVDFGIIEELAKDLPLSKRKRPTWDVETLCHLNVSDIEIHFPTGVDMHDDRLVRSFTIILTKGA